MLQLIPNIWPTSQTNCIFYTEMSQWQWYSGHLGGSQNTHFELNNVTMDNIVDNNQMYIFLIAQGMN